ncbi:hypothetical protein ACOKM3_20945 [Streptomyces sp. BH106]|uniref:hypothetical protein n=1 Tax=Streptomyces sp. BH106 TaxID=3410409 RepID=UPI003CFB0007
MSGRTVRPAADRAPSRHKEQGPSPLEAERILPLARGQVDDRLRELGALYAANCGAEAGQWDRVTHAFVRRLMSDIRRPGFGLLIAENSRMTAYAYGFPLHRGLFEIREIVVPRRARVRSPHQDWNLARRLQRRLLADHGHSTGITLVDRSDVWTHAALRSWGWRDAPDSAYGAPVRPHRTVLLLDP